MRELIYSTAAKGAMADILRHIALETRSLTIGTAFISKLAERCGYMASLPGTLGTPRPDLHPDMRAKSHRGYMIFFRYVGHRLEIVNILDGQRCMEPDADH